MLDLDRNPEGHTYAMSDNIIREDPPSVQGKGKTNRDFQGIADKLRADPGNWYRILEDVRNPELVSRINSGRIAAFRPAETFEAKSRRVGEKSFTVWARYVGTDHG